MVSVLNATQGNNVRMLQVLIGMPQCIKQDELDQALVLACKQGLHECAQVLISSGIDINLIRNQGLTPLKLAASGGHVEVVQLLTDAQCDLEIGYGGRGTALHFAAINGYEKCVAVLLDAGADPNSVDREGCTPLVLACQNPHKSYAAIQKLLTADIKVNKADRYGKTALHYVTPKALHIEALLKVGADVNACDIDGSTPLLAAASEGFDHVVKLFTEYECDPNIVTPLGRSAMHILALKGHVKGMEHLFDIGGDINLQDRDGYSPLWFAIQENQINVVKFLLRANCRLNPPPECGSDTPWHCPLDAALNKQRFHLAKMLIVAGCDITPLLEWLENNPLDSVEDENQEAVEFLDQMTHVPRVLRQMCRMLIRKILGDDLQRKSMQLPIPPSLQDYITLKELEQLHD